MSTRNRKRNTIFFSLLALALLILWNYYPVIYYDFINKWGNTNIKPMVYSYDFIPISKLIMNFRKLDTSLVTILIKKTAKHHAKITIYDQKKGLFYHLEVDDNMKDNMINTIVLFCYVSKSLEQTTKKRINKDFDRLTNYQIIKQFENIVINRLPEIKPTVIYAW